MSPAASRSIIIPQADGGADTEDNAAPLCPSCHETYGANREKQKLIRDRRDLWYELCAKQWTPSRDVIDVLDRLLEKAASSKAVKAFNAIRADVLTNAVKLIVDGLYLERWDEWTALLRHFLRLALS